MQYNTISPRAKGAVTEKEHPASPRHLHSAAHHHVSLEAMPSRSGPTGTETLPWTGPIPPLGYGPPPATHHCWEGTKSTSTATSTEASSQGGTPSLGMACQGAEQPRVTSPDFTLGQGLEGLLSTLSGEPLGAPSCWLGGSFVAAAALAAWGS